MSSCFEILNFQLKSTMIGFRVWGLGFRVWGLGFGVYHGRSPSNIMGSL